jgi:serine/threonine-protein kinase
VNHPNVLRILDVADLDEGGPFLVTELLHGERFDSIIERSVSFPMEVACELVRQTLCALDAVHACGVVHRDLKPDNLILESTPYSTPCVKLVDFGIACGGGATRVTLPDTIVGTVEYLSPEQACGGPIDPRVDLWAAGILFYELLTGRTPYRARTTPETIAAIIVADAPDVRELRPDLPSGIAEVVRWALERTPARRVPSARRMKRAIERAVALNHMLIGPDALLSIGLCTERAIPFDLMRFKSNLAACAI